MMELSDPYTSKHAQEVESLVKPVGRSLSLGEEELEELELAARFHDIGKVAVPEQLLRKPAPLTEPERQVLACHVEWGAELLRHLPGCETIALIVRHHHERYDGRGYPDGLKATEIPLPSRIIGACDAYGAMVTDRPYRRALEPERAVAELCDNAGSQFDPDAVDAIVTAIGRARNGAASGNS
jgi:HD-GYP domain-containing protein (c-di-GMP phosphodiesterase class II)